MSEKSDIDLGNDSEANKTTGFVSIGYKKDKSKCGRFNERYLEWVQNHKSFNQWLDDTTIHGTVHVFKSKTLFRRLIWSVIFLIAVGGCLFTVIRQVQRFASFPASTTVSLVRNQNTGLPFPAVTVCNQNFLRNGSVSKDVIDVMSAFQTLDSDSCHLALISLSPSNGNMPFRKFLLDGLQPIDEFIELCVFIGYNGTDDVVLDCKNMFVPTLTDAGYCYTFNGDVNAPNLFVRNTGSRYGLQLTLNLSLSEYLSSTPVAGVRVAVHNREDPPQPDDKGIAVPPQQNGFIGLRKSRISDNSTKKACVEDGCLPFFPEYSLPACTLSGYYETVANNCMCIATVNNTQNLRNCKDETLEVTALPDCNLRNICCILDQVFVSSGRACTSSCDYRTFEFSTSYSALAPSFSRDIVAVSVFFEELYEENIITEDSFTFSALLGSIGGQLGLFLGASIISMIELGLFILDDILEYCLAKCKQYK